jgi:hypothetical protein
MHVRPSRQSLTTKVLRPPFTLDGKKDHLVCYLWGGRIRPPENPRGIAGTQKDWEPARDSVLCKRVLEQTGFGVHCPEPPYRSSWEWSDKEGRIIPKDFVKRFYDLAKKRRYKWVHLLGFSGGGSVLSSALVHHSDNKYVGMVKSLAIISGPIAEHAQHKDEDKNRFTCIPYTDAALYAENVRAKTLLIYGEEDFLKEGATEWSKRNKVQVPSFYHGGHDFGREGQETFEWVAKTVIDWLKNSTDQGVRPLRLRRRRRKRHAKRRAVRRL